MSTSQAVWQDWIAFLHQKGMAKLTASLLEATSPLAVAGAQLLYVGEPILSAFLPTSGMNAILELLEDDRKYHGFITALKEGGES